MMFICDRSECTCSTMYSMVVCARLNCRPLEYFQKKKTKRTNSNLTSEGKVEIPSVLFLFSLSVLYMHL